MNQSTTDPNNENFIYLGKLVGAYGVKGWIKVQSETRPETNIGNYKRWYLVKANERQTFELEQIRQHGKGLIAKLVGIDDRDAAESLLKRHIEVEISELPGLDAGEYYWHQLINCDVFNQESIHLGRVEKIVETGANDVIVVKGTNRYLIPWVNDVYIKNINIEENRIDVEWEIDS